MEAITLSRKELYEKIWSVSISKLLDVYELSEDGFYEVCKRLNIPTPDKNHWKKVDQGKKTTTYPFPEESQGSETVTLYLKENEENREKNKKQLINFLRQVNPELDLENKNALALDKLIITSKEELYKNWHDRSGHGNGKKYLDIRVSPEKAIRALLIMDLLIKLLKSKSHNLIVVEGSTFALIEGEKIQISLRERNKKVEFIDDYKSIRKDTHPTGILYIKREEGYSNKEWKDGKIPLEDQLIKIIEDLTSIAKEQKEDNLRRKKSQEVQAEQNRLQQEFEKRQKIELANFKGLLLDAHRFWLSTMVRDYVARVEMNAKSSDALTQETQEWISWARKKADWYDPTILLEEDELLKDIDLENLKTNEPYYSGMNFYNNSEYTQRERSFWKPFWAK